MTDRASRIAEQLAKALDTLEKAKPFAKANHQNYVYEMTLRLLKQPNGVSELYRLAPRFDQAGVFYGTDWDFPSCLQPRLVADSLQAGGLSLAIECLSQLRLLAVVNGEVSHFDISPEAARKFLEEAIALNVHRLFPQTDEASRVEAGPLMEGVSQLLQFIADRLGLDGILVNIVDEVERILQQRPIETHRIRGMIEGLPAQQLNQEQSEVRRRAERLIAAVRGPTTLSRQAANAGEYEQALAQLDTQALRQEATAFASSMRETGLVCPYHAVLLRFFKNHYPAEIPLVLRLDDVGRDTLNVFQALIHRLIDEAVFPSTAQCIYGLACFLERGILFFPPVAPGLWRLIGVPVQPQWAEELQTKMGADPPPANSILLAGTISLLGQPLGIGQGNNPTCQSARAISLWAQSDVGFLLEIIAWAARDNEIDMHFEGQLICSRDLQPGLAGNLHTELDPVSLVLVPHLDKIYSEMGRRIVGRNQDGHRWINPEFHGWWVHRGFASAIEYSTGAVIDFKNFIRKFYATYHPYYNGGRMMVYPQPAGIAATNSQGAFIGWHAVAIQRVGLDLEGKMRVYFFNPNNDSGQDWGQNIVTSTGGHSELAGESSLLFHEFAARLYLFHYNPREQGDPLFVPAQEVDEIVSLVRNSWAANLAWKEVLPT